MRNTHNTDTISASKLKAGTIDNKVARGRYLLHQHSEEEFEKRIKSTMSKKYE